MVFKGRNLKLAVDKHSKMNIIYNTVQQRCSVINVTALTVILQYIIVSK